MRNQRGHQTEERYRLFVILKMADMAQYNSVIGLNFLVQAHIFFIKVYRQSNNTLNKIGQMSASVHTI